MIKKFKQEFENERNHYIKYSGTLFDIYHTKDLFALNELIFKLENLHKSFEKFAYINDKYYTEKVIILNLKTIENDKKLYLDSYYFFIFSLGVLVMLAYIINFFIFKIKE